MKRIKTLCLSASCLALSLSAGSGFGKGDDENLERLGAFKRTDAAPMNMEL